MATKEKQKATERKGYIVIDPRGVMWQNLKTNQLEVIQAGKLVPRDAFDQEQITEDSIAALIKAGRVKAVGGSDLASAAIEAAVGPGANPAEIAGKAAQAASEVEALKKLKVADLVKIAVDKKLGEAKALAGKTVDELVELITGA